MSENANPVQTMDSQRVWELLSELPYGRLAVQAAGLVAIFPVNHVGSRRRLFFRPAQGTTAIDVPFTPLPLLGARIRYRLFPKVAL